MLKKNNLKVEKIMASDLVFVFLCNVFQVYKKTKTLFFIKWQTLKICNISKTVKFTTNVQEKKLVAFLMLNNMVSLFHKINFFNILIFFIRPQEILFLVPGNYLLVDNSVIL